MKVALSLLLLLGMTFAMLGLPREGDVRPFALTMTVGFAMLGAWLTGRLFDLARLPRISGYLLFGVFVGPSTWALFGSDFGNEIIQRAMPLMDFTQVRDLRFIKDLAIALIAITAGGEIHLPDLKGQVRRIGLLTVAAVVGVAVVVGGAIAAAQTLPGPGWFGAGLEPATQVLAIVLLALIASGNSPAMAIALISELRSDGPLSRMMLVLTVCKDLLLIVLFSAALAVGQGIVGGGGAGGGFALAVAAELIGSLLVGGLAGLVLAMLVGRMRGNFVLFVIGICFGFAMLGEQHFHMPLTDETFHFKPLLLALSAGLTMRNATPGLTAPLFSAIERMSLPVYCLFFAVAGAELRLGVFTNAATATAIVAVVLIRAGAIAAIVGGVGRLIGLDPAWRGRLWLCLIPQSGVTLALATLLHDAFAPAGWAERLFDMLLGLVAIHALLGPVLCRWALVRSGEAGAAGGGAAGQRLHSAS